MSFPKLTSCIKGLDAKHERPRDQSDLAYPFVAHEALSPPSYEAEAGG